MISKKEKAVLECYQSACRVFAECYGEQDCTTEVFVLMQDPEKLIARLEKLGREYGLDHCGSSFQETGHWIWLDAINHAGQLQQMKTIG